MKINHQSQMTDVFVQALPIKLTKIRVLPYTQSRVDGSHYCYSIINVPVAKQSSKHLEWAINGHRVVMKNDHSGVSLGVGLALFSQ